MNIELKDFARQYGLTDVEKFSQSVSSYECSFVANKLKQTEITHNSGLAFRVLSEGKIGFASGYGIENSEDVLIQAKELSKFYPTSNIEFPSNLNLSESQEIVTKNFLEDFKLQGNEMIDYIKSCINSDSVLIDLSFDVLDSNETIENTNNLHYSSIKRSYSFSINLRETIKSDFIDIFSAITDKDQLNVTECVNEVIDLYKNAKKHAIIKNAQMPVLFSSRAAKDLISIVELALSGKQVNQNSSPWSESLGKQVLSNKISMRQDPAYGFMSRKVDDEGVIVQPLSLIKNGILQNFYYDLQTAKKSPRNITSTGNGFKTSLTALPEPELLNVIVEPGTKSLNDIIKSIDYGLYVDQTMGGLSANISGDLSVNVDLGFLIERGEIKGRVKDTMVSGNIYKALNNVLELSSSLKGYWSSVYNPDMLLDGLMVISGNE